jgi:tetratricopeptide (TPR) repeat protein
MPARQAWIHKENHKKGNKHSDIIRFGDFLDLDYLVSGEYTVKDGLIKVVLKIWEIRTQNMHAVRHAEKKTAFYRLATALSAAFLKMADAKAVFRQAPTPAVPPNVFGIFAKAVDAYAAGQVSDAVYAANRTLDFAQDFLPALALLADIYLLAGRPKAALKAVKAAVKADPHHCRTLAAYGEILSAGARPDQALKVLKAEKSRCGDTYFFNAAFGRIYLEEGFFVIAISYFVKAISEYPAITELYFL